MKIDYISDLHLDFYFSPQEPIEEVLVKSIFDIIFSNKSGNVLIIAGDIGHYNEQNIQILKILQKNYYKYIVTVLGNHDYYLYKYEHLIKYNKNSFLRAKELKDMINAQPNMFCLDGNVIEIENIRFGGAMGWYDNSYAKYYYPSKSEKKINDDWKNFCNDSDKIWTIKSYDELFENEYKKLEAVYKECEVMISHVNPSFKHEHIDKSFHFDITNTFFTFNGHNLIKNGTMLHWIFGHTHTNLEYQLNGVQIHCNPMGLPEERVTSNLPYIKSFEI